MKEPSFFNRIATWLRQHPLISAAVVILCLVALIFLRGAGREPISETSYYVVKRGDFTVSIVEGGQLESVKEVIIRNEVEGTSRIIYMVPEGTFVKEGDLLVELDSMQAQDQFNQQQIAFEKAQYALLSSEKQLDIERSVVDSEVRAAELKLQFAKMDLDKYLEGEARVELLTASNNITKTEAQLSIDKDTLKWSEELHDKGFETKNVLDRDRLSVTNQELTLQIQAMQLWMIENFDYQRKKTELESDVVEAGMDLERVKQQGANKLIQFQADVLTQSNTLSLNQKKLERDQKNLDSCLIEAPQDGLVVYPMGDNRFSSESMIEEGATVRNRQELIKLPDTSQMKVTIKVHESHVNMVQAGQPAVVVLDSMPDKQFRAVVEKVGLLPDAQSRWGNPNLKVYKTEILITDPIPDVKPGISARAEIIITRIKDALSVPIQAVTTLKGKQVVYLANGRDPKPAAVEVGLFNTRFIEIISGLTEGDQVLLSPPFDSQEKDLEGAILDSEDEEILTNAPPRPTITTQREAPGAEGAAGADEGGRPAAAGGPGAAQMNPEQMRAQFEEMRKQFDKDGDGELNDEERQAMRAEMQSRFSGMGAGGQRGGGGGGGAGGGMRGGGQRPPQ